jgi:hypothetical protein
MVQKWAAELPAKTGRPLDEWAAVVRGWKLPAADARARLKAETGLGTNTAWWLVEYANPAGYLRAAEGFVAAAYAGPKAHLFPIFEKLVEYGRSLGADVLVCPCKTMVPLYRSRVFAEIKATTRTRVDLALALGDAPAAGVLAVNAPRMKKGDRLTHLIALAAAADVTAEVKRWLKAAYRRDAE